MAAVRGLQRQPANFYKPILLPNAGIIERVRLLQTPIFPLPRGAPTPLPTPPDSPIDQNPVNLKKRKLDDFASDGCFVASGHTHTQLAVTQPAHLGPSRSMTALSSYFRALRAFCGVVLGRLSITYAVYTGAFGAKRRVIGLDGHTDDDDKPSSNTEEAENRADSSSGAGPSTPPPRPRGILRKPGAHGPTNASLGPKRLTFYASPTSGEPVSSIQVFEKVSPVPSPDWYGDDDDEFAPPQEDDDVFASSEAEEDLGGFDADQTILETMFEDSIGESSESSSDSFESYPQDSPSAIQEDDEPAIPSHLAETSSLPGSQDADRLLSSFSPTGSQGADRSASASAPSLFSPPGSQDADRLQQSQRRSWLNDQWDQDLFDDALAKLQLADEQNEDQERKDQQRVLNASADPRRLGRLVPTLPIVAPLSSYWEDEISTIMAMPSNRVVAGSSNGLQLTRHDLGTLLPQDNTDDNDIGWLNDEIVNGTLELYIAYALKQTDHEKGKIPKFYAFVSMFMNNIMKKGPHSVARWAKRAGIGGKNLWKVDYIFIPICNNAHWTLLVCMPSRKVVEYFDSLQGKATQYYQHISRWLQQELDHEFIPTEWTFKTGYGPTQTNAKDCGVFVITTAKMIMLGLDPELSYTQDDLPLQRKHITCELINGEISGDLEPLECGYPGITRKTT